MAPLKGGCAALSPGLVGVYPWMKIHGPIEGRLRRSALFSSPFYPWMKIHGPIEGNVELQEVAGVKIYPWMKIHGPIEGMVMAGLRLRRCTSIHG